MFTKFVALTGGFAAILATTLPLDDDKDSKKASGDSTDARRAGQRGLEPFNDWVGSWRGVGQPKRGSNKGAWTEKADWEWKIDKESASMQIEIKDGKQFQAGNLSYQPDQKKFRFVATLPGDGSRTYVGERGEEGKVILTSSDEQTKDQYRLTFQMRHADRMLLLIETKPAGQPSFARVAEVGYTREGGSFAAAADGGPKCIVTGGRGTTPVQYKGKTYYVCCSGCKQAFDDDPEGIIADAAERTKKEAADRKKK